MHVSLHITLHIIRSCFDVLYILIRIGACIDYLRIVISWSISNILVTKICVSWALTGARVYRSYRANSVHIGGADIGQGAPYQGKTICKKCHDICHQYDRYNLGEYGTRSGGLWHFLRCPSPFGMSHRGSPDEREDAKAARRTSASSLC